MQLVLLSLSADCGTPDYPRVLYAEDSAMSYTISESGMEKFIECGLGSAIVFAEQLAIPDISQQLDLGVTQILFQLRDLHIAELSTGHVDISLSPEAQEAHAAAHKIKIQVHFQWNFQQQSYPYLSDGGSGQLIVDGIEVVAQVGAGCDYSECPGHLVVKIDRADLDFGSIHIDLQGGSSWIYESLIDLILGAIEGQISDMISDVLIQSSEELMNQMMQSSGYYWPYKEYNDTIKDDRFVSGLEMGSGYMVIRYSGYVYNTKNLTDEFINRDMLNDITYNKYNRQVQFTFSRAGFDNAYYIFHKYYDAYSGEAYDVTEPPTLQFVNTGSLTTLHVRSKLAASEGKEYTYHLFGEPMWRTDKQKDPDAGTRNVTQIFFNFSLYDVQDENRKDCSESPDVQELTKAVLATMNEKIQYANYQIDSTPFMVMEGFTASSDSDEQVFRLSEDLPEECPTLG